MIELLVPRLLLVVAVALTGRYVEKLAQEAAVAHMRLLCGSAYFL